MRIVSKQLFRAGALVAVLCTGSFLAQAQSSEPKGDKIVTGCLQKGHEVGEYSITGEDGRTYDLHSTSVKLADHLGHKVTITGKASPEGDKKGGQAAADLDVSNLKMVSTSCQ